MPGDEPRGRENDWGRTPKAKGAGGREGKKRGKGRSVYEGPGEKTRGTPTGGAGGGKPGGFLDKKRGFRERGTSIIWREGGKARPPAGGRGTKTLDGGQRRIHQERAATGERREAQGGGPGERMTGGTREGGGGEKRAKGEKSERETSKSGGADVGGAGVWGHDGEGERGDLSIPPFGAGGEGEGPDDPKRVTGSFGRGDEGWGFGQTRVRGGKDSGVLLPFWGRGPPLGARPGPQKGGGKGGKNAHLTKEKKKGKEKKGKGFSPKFKKIDFPIFNF